MPERTVTRSIKNLADMSIAEIENDIEYLLFVDNEKLFPMSEYTKLLPVVAELAKLVTTHADAAAEKMQRETVDNVARHLKNEVTNIVYSSKVPIIETLVITEPEEEVVDTHGW